MPSPAASLRENAARNGQVLAESGLTALEHFVRVGAGVRIIDWEHFDPRGSFVHDFRTNPYLYNGTFAGALPGPMVTYNLAGQDRNWAEVSGGLSIDTGRIGLSLSADTTIGRDDVKNQAYRAAISLRF